MSGPEMPTSKWSRDGTPSRLQPWRLRCPINSTKDFICPYFALWKLDMSRNPIS